MLKNEGERLSRVIVCTPEKEYFDIDNLRKHNILEVADRQRAKEQHDAMKEIMKEFGAEVIDLPEFPAHPNSVFTRDTAMCTPKGYIKLRLGLETRQGEDDWMARALNALGEPCIGEIKIPGTVEGGDVVLAGKVAFVGHTIRTNKEGIRQLSALLIPMGIKTRTIHLPDTILHLDKALMPVGPNRILYCDGLVPDDTLHGFETIKISCSENSTANIICLGENELVVGKSNLQVIKLLTDQGLIVHELDISEFVKGSAGPNCLIMPLERI